jgi:hypothetical protein
VHVLAGEVAVDESGRDRVERQHRVHASGGGVTEAGWKAWNGLGEDQLFASFPAGVGVGDVE